MLKVLLMVNSVVFPCMAIIISEKIKLLTFTKVRYLYTFSFS